MKSDTVVKSMIKQTNNPSTTGGFCIILKQFETDGALEKRLTHMPFTHAFTGSNPVRVTNLLMTETYVSVFFVRENYRMIWGFREVLAMYS